MKENICPLCGNILTIYYQQLSNYNFEYCSEKIRFEQLKPSHYQIQKYSPNNSLYQIRYIIEPYIIRVYPNENITNISFFTELKSIEYLIKLPHILEINSTNIDKILDKLSTIRSFS